MEQRIEQDYPLITTLPHQKKLVCHIRKPVHSMLAISYNDAAHALLDHIASLTAFLHAALMATMGTFGGGASG